MNNEWAQCEAENWWEAAHDKDPVAKVRICLGGYGIEDWAKDQLSEQIVELVRMAEARTLDSMRKAVTR